MPLYRQNGQRAVHKPLDHVIPGTADRGKPFPDAVYGLMMGGVYDSAVSVELVKEIPLAQITAVDGMELIVTDPFVGIGGVDVLRDVAAEVDVNKLKALADAKHGLFLCHKTGEKLELQDVQFGVHIVGAVVCLAEKGGRNVAAAGEKQMGGLLCVFGGQQGAVGDAQTFQDFFIVLRIFTAACDDHRRKRGHRACSF